MVVIVFGLPGSGKSFFAERLAVVLKAAYLNSDRVRIEMHSGKTYSEHEKRTVYHQMLIRTTQLLKQKKTVIVDGTFYKKEIRDDFKKINDTTYWIEVRAEDKTIMERLNKPRLYSDADFDVYKKIKIQWEPLTENHLVLKSQNNNIQSMMEKALSYLRYDKK